MDEPLSAKIMDLLIDTICVVDHAGCFIYVSASGEHLFGYAPEELRGRNMIELVHPDDRARTLSAVDEIMDGGPLMHFENRYVRKDGRIVHIMWSARWSESDRLRLAVARDVTELRRAAQIKQALYEISEAAHAAEGLPPLYPLIHRIIGKLLPAECFHVCLYDMASGRLSFPYYIDGRDGEPRAEPDRSLQEDHFIAEVIHSGHVLIRSTTLAPMPDGTEAVCEGDWIGVPLASQNGVIGALVLRTHGSNGRDTAEDMELLQFVSTQVATAIERKQAETRLQYMALHDALTGLPNRTLFYDRFDMALEHAKRDGNQLALLYLDLDDFKRINDECGHEMGDHLLRAVVERLVKCVRAQDTVGRMGGDEFTVLLSNIQGPGNVKTIENKISNELSVPFVIGSEYLSITVSIGRAIYPDDGDNREALLHLADAGMYAGKRKNGVS